MDYKKESLIRHAAWKGKIEVVPRCELKNRDDLSTAYTPGVAQPCLEIQADPDKSYEYTRRGNLVAVISDGSAVLGLGNIGGLAGMNEGTVTGCQVENGALSLGAGLRAGTNTVTLGGGGGRTTKDGTVSETNVLLDLTQNLDKYTNLGGVAGQNDGTQEQ